MALPEKEQRLGGETEALSMSLAGDLHSVAVATGPVRCTRCDHPIHARESVRVGMGPICRREVAA